MKFLEIGEMTIHSGANFIIIQISNIHSLYFHIDGPVDILKRVGVYNDNGWGY